MEETKVSVIMPAYNCEKFIADSINSVINQTYKNWELIIVNDCSTDRTEEVIKKIDDSRIKYYKNKINSGAAVSRNFAIKKAVGNYIAFLDGDDLWVSEKLAKQINFMKMNNYYFSYTNYEHISEDSNKLNFLITGPNKITKKMMFNSCYVGCLTAMYDADYVGLLQIENLKKRNDYAMWLKIIVKTNCYLLNENLACYRKVNGSLSNISKFKLLKHHYRLFKYGEKMSVGKATWYTMMNLLYGMLRKIKYCKKMR